MTWSSPWRLLWFWTLASIPATGIASGVAHVLHDALLDSPGGFLSLPLGEGMLFLIGGATGLAWGAGLSIPHLFLLRLWVGVSRFFGDTDVTLGRIFIGMSLWALPQAVAVGVVAGGAGFLAAWLVVTAGLWLPRAVVRRLRPGVFGS